MTDSAQAEGGAWRPDPKNPVRVLSRAAERDASKAVNDLGFMLRVLTAAIIEHGPITVSNESIGEAAFRDIVWQQTEDGVRLEAHDVH